MLDQTECEKVSTVYCKNVTAEQEMDKSLNSEIEKDKRMMIIQQLKDENTELKDRVGHLEQKMAETQVRIVTATPSYCKKIHDISQRKENAIVCLIIDGSDLFGVIDHYPTNKELENMIASIMRFPFMKQIKTCSTIPLEECWNISKNDLLVLAYYASFTDFRKRVGHYFRTKHFNLNMRNYLAGHMSADIY